MKQVGEVRIDAKTKVQAFLQEEVKNPRAVLGGNKVGKLCVMTHKQLSFPNELCFDFEKDKIEEVMKTHWVLLIDIGYDNGVAHFSITDDDKSPKCVGFIAVPRTMEVQKSAGIFERQAEYETVTFTQIEAERISQEELDEYNAYLRGESYTAVLKKMIKRTSKELGDKFEREEINRVEGLSTIEECFTYYNT